MTDKQITYEQDAKDCSQCNSESVCCYCKNIACYELEKQFKAKEQECEKLKQFLSKEPLALQALQSGYASYKKSSEVFYEMVKQYKQTLTEIKEIAKYELNNLTESAVNGGRYVEILQKISEVEDEIQKK